MKKTLTTLTFLMLALVAFAQRSEVLLEKNWKFHRGEAENAFEINYDDSKCQMFM